jgi:MFS family permease
MLKALGAGAAGASIPRSVLAAMVAGFRRRCGMGLAPVWPLALLATAVAGFTATWCGVSLQAAIQTDLPDAYRGRVMSLWTVVGFGTVAIGAGLIGGLAEVMWASAPRWWWPADRAGRHGAVALRGCTRLKFTLSRGANDARARKDRT